MCANSVPVGETCPQCGYLHTAIKNSARAVVTWLFVVGLVVGAGYLVYRHYNGGGHGGYGDYGWR
jgi:hypothetical protein